MPDWLLALWAGDGRWLLVGVAVVCVAVGVWLMVYDD